MRHTQWQKNNYPPCCQDNHKNEKRMRVSYSALETYKTCPLKFKYQEIDKIKAPKSIEAIFGSSVHSALKQMFSRTPLYPTLDEIVNFFTVKWQARLPDGQEKKPEEIDEETLKAYFEEGITLLKNFYKKNPPWNFNAVELESRFEVQIEDTLNKKTHTLAGIIDRIDKSPENDVYEIIDYKTSKRMPPQNDLDKNLQLSIYNLGLIKRWPHLKQENIKLSLYFLKHNEKIETKRTIADLEDTKNEILEIIREIEALISESKEFIPTPSPLCDWCGYRKICPMWRHLYQTNDLTPITNDQIKDTIGEYFELSNQNKNNKKRIGELQKIVYEFMKQENLDRVFGEEGYLTKTTQEREIRDMKKIKQILEEMKKWDEVCAKKQYTVLKASKNKTKIL